MAGEQIINAKNEELGKLANYSISTGLNSAYPGGSTNTYPNLTATVVSEAPLDMIFEANKQVQLRGSYRSPTSGTPTTRQVSIFKGELASTKSSEISGRSSLNVDGIAAQLNQDIATYPIIGGGIGDSAPVNTNFAVAYALYHWMSECQIFRWLHPGIMELQVPNTKYGIGYYNQPIARLYGVNFPSSSVGTTSWLATAPDMGIRFVKGDKLHFVSIFSQYAVPQPEQSVNIRFDSAVSVSGVTYDLPALRFVQNTATRVVSVFEESTGTTQAIHSFTLPVGSRDAKVDCEAHRTSATQVVYTTQVSYIDASNNPQMVSQAFTRNNTLLPDILRVQEVLMSNTSDDFRGVDTFYVVRTDVFRSTLSAISLDGLRVAIPVSTPSGVMPVIPGLTGNCWALVNDICTYYSLTFEPSILQVLNAASINPSTEAQNHVLDPIVLEGQARELAETVEVVNYNHRMSSSFSDEIELWRADSTYSLARGERQEHTIRVDGSLVYAVDPRIVNPDYFIEWTRGKQAVESIYCVFGADNTTVNVGEWADKGGFIRFEQTGVPGEVKLVIQAPQEALTKAAPYTISLEGSLPALTLAGIGVKERKETLTIHTGAGQVPKKVGTTHDSPLVSATWLARNVGAGLGAQYGTSVTSATGGYAVGYEPDSMPPFAPYYIRKQGSLYRVLGASMTQSHVDISGAERYVRCMDVNSEYAGMTCAQVNALFAGKDINYHNLAPLKRFID